MADNQAGADSAETTGTENEVSHVHTPNSDGDSQELADYYREIGGIVDDLEGDEPPLHPDLVDDVDPPPPEKEDDDLPEDLRNTDKDEEEDTPPPASSESTQKTGEDPPPPQGVEKPGETPNKDSTNRFRFQDPEDVAIAALARAKNISLAKAAAEYHGTAAPGASQQQSQEEQPPARTVATVDEEIRALRTQKAEAMSAFEAERAVELEAQIDALVDERQDLKLSERTAAARREEEAETAFDRDFEESQSRAVGHYPDSAIADSPLCKRIVELDQQAKRLNDPVFFSPNKPFLLAQKAALELGILMQDPKAVKKPEAPPATPAAAPGKAPIQPKPAGGSAGTSQAAAPSATGMEARIAGVDSLDDYEALVGH